MIFGSDNQSAASLSVLKGLIEAFTVPGEAYGSDAYCKAAEEALKSTFGTDLSAFFVVSGTAANSLALASMAKPWQGIICHHQAHIILDESSAPALFTGGASLLPVPTKQLKLEPASLREMLERLPSDRPHNIEPRVLSLSQASECGQVYSPPEVETLSAVAGQAGLLVHMDGARFANAVAALKCDPGDVSWRAGVDVLTLGATKNGAVAAEAIVFFNKNLAEDFDFQLKRSGHLVSKGRFFGAQFVPWLAEGHWLQLATTANEMALSLRARVETQPEMRLAFETQSNETFVFMQRQLFDGLIAAGASMYGWYPDALPPDVNAGEGEVLVRLVTSFATTGDEITDFFATASTLS